MGGLLFGALALLKGLLRVAAAHLEQIELLAPPRDQDPYPFPLPFRKQLRKTFSLVHLERKQDFFGYEIVVGVIEVDERSEQLRVRKLLAGEWKRLASSDPPLANVKRVNQEPVRLAVEAENVQIDWLRERDLLPLQASLDGMELVAQPSGFFKLELAGRVLNPPTNPFNQLLGLALEK